MNLEWREQNNRHFIKTGITSSNLNSTPQDAIYKFDGLEWLSTLVTKEKIIMDTKIGLLVYRMTLSTTGTTSWLASGEIRRENEDSWLLVREFVVCGARLNPDRIKYWSEKDKLKSGDSSRQLLNVNRN